MLMIGSDSASDLLLASWCARYYLLNVLILIVIVVEVWS
jgi:hypothetical protein